MAVASAELVALSVNAIDLVTLFGALSFHSGGRNILDTADPKRRPAFGWLARQARSPSLRAGHGKAQASQDKHVSHVLTALLAR